MLLAPHYGYALVLSYEQQFAILGQGPHFVVDHELEFVNVVTYLVEQGDYSVVIGNGTFSHAINLVSCFAIFDHFIHFVLDEQQVF